MILSKAPLKLLAKYKWLLITEFKELRVLKLIFASASIAVESLCHSLTKLILDKSFLTS